MLQGQSVLSPTCDGKNAQTRCRKAAALCEARPQDRAEAQNSTQPRAIRWRGSAQEKMFFILIWNSEGWYLSEAMQAITIQVQHDFKWAQNLRMSIWFCVVPSNNVIPLNSPSIKQTFSMLPFCLDIVGLTQMFLVTSCSVQKEFRYCSYACWLTGRALPR